MLRRMSSSALHSSTTTSYRFVGLHGGQTKCMTAKQAAELVRTGDTITVSGFVGQSPPEGVLRALAERYTSTKEPAALTLCFHGGPGDWATKGLNHLAKPGMLAKTIGAHYGQTPKIAELVQKNEIVAYNVPMGTICRMIRAGASGRPGYSTTIGLDTMADPLCGGGRLNAKTEKHLATRVTNPVGEEELWYPAIQPNVAVIRGTTADTDGNISFEKESLYLDCLNQAMAARSNGGIVICQVERLAEKGTINPRNVRVPGALVDVVVVAEKPEDHPMSFATQYNPAFSGELRVPTSQEVMPLDERKIIARRAALNLLPGQIVNLGIGMPEGVANVAAEEGIMDQVSLTTEPGTHGGLGASGHDFGPAVNYSGLLEMHQQFDFYNGGGLDICFLGMAEVTRTGDVNVTRVGPKLTGPGGFIDISQSTQRVNMVGTFTAGGLEIEVVDGKLKIVKEGRIKKFVKSIPEITFSAKRANINGQAVKYITERCVFSLSGEGIVLSEVAPGIDIERDILRQMEFTPLMPVQPSLMNPLIFTQCKMGLADSLKRIDLGSRLFHVTETNTLFIDLASVKVLSREDIQTIIGGVEAYIAKELRGSKFHVEVNYFGFHCAPHLEAEYANAIAAIEARHYLSCRRHVGRTFTHLKAAFARHPTPDHVDVDAALKYLHQHNIQVSVDNFKAHFNQVAAGQKELNREAFADLIAKLPSM